MSKRSNHRSSLLGAGLGIALLVGAADLGAQSASGAAMTRPGSGSAGATPSAATGSTAAKPMLNAADRSFVQKAATGGMAEVQLGKMAQQKGSSDQVKQFGARMAEDHGRANDELTRIAGSKGMTPPTELDAKHQGEMAKLEKLSGASFDRAYMDAMVKDHKEDVAAFRKQAASGSDSELKAFAAKTLPTLEDHLKMAQQTQSAVKGAKADSR